MLREQLCRAGYLVSSCVENKEVTRTIVFPRGTNIPCICAVACPGTAGFRGFINNSFAPKGGQEGNSSSHMGHVLLHMPSLWDQYKRGVTC
jgi:hypothetical protein